MTRWSAPFSDEPRDVYGAIYLQDTALAYWKEGYVSDYIWRIANALEEGIIPAEEDNSEAA